MNIYVGHSNGFNFKEELYKPLRASDVDDKHNIVLPHENSTEPFNSEEYLKECDLMIAEVSYASTGLGMELGWAHLYKVPIVAIHNNNVKAGGSLKVVTSNFIPYENEKDMIYKLSKFIDNFS